MQVAFDREFPAKAKNAALRRMIDSNKEEAISYLKSIGAML